MYFSRSLLVFVPAVCLMAQAPPSRTVPLTDKDGKPIIGDNGKPATVTLSTVTPPAPGVDLATIPRDKVLLSIGEDKITAGELSDLVAGLPEQFREQLRGAGRRQFADSLVRMKVLAQEARKRKLDQTPAFRVQSAFQVENLLANQEFAELSKTTPVTEAAARAYYEQHRNEFDQVRAWHILIRTKGSPVPIRPGQADLSDEAALAKAQEIRQKLAEGADFAAVATAESDDTGTGQKGGDLGFLTHGRTVPSFEDAVFKLPVGQLSEPVKTQFGYHIIKVTEKKSFEQMRPDIDKRMGPEMARQALDDLRKKVNIALDPEFFGPDPAAPSVK
jgi:parvulin-like peptidyl-prolyl isomerase